MFDIFWLHAWADHAEASGVSLSQCAIEDVADVPTLDQRQIVDKHVNKLWTRLEELNGCSVDVLYQRAVEADGGVETEDEERFGGDLAWMSMGAGVSWFDDHQRFDLKVPYMEWNMYDLF